MTPGAMVALRTATATVHVRLEGRIDLDARLDSLDAYARFLTRFLGFYTPMEERLAPFATVIAGLGYDERRKTALLVADLDALGAPSDPEHLRCAAALPEVRSADEALGVLYVLEGSTLGGSVIARQAQRRLGVTPATGGSFFAPYGATTGSRWRAFAAVVETTTGGSAAPAMTAAAVSCFATLEAWMCD